MSSYLSNDQGDINQLNKITVQKTLSLKVNCPVILLKNITPDLVNGLQGTVKRLESDGPTVFFHSKNITKGLHKYLSIIHNPKLNIDTASRSQYLIKLAFAFTIHKSQGMTVPIVEVNCKNINQPGQPGIADGRTVSVEELCVKNYDKNICRPHSSEIQDEPTSCHRHIQGCHQSSGRDAARCNHMFFIPNSRWKGTYGSY